MMMLEVMHIWNINNHWRQHCIEIDHRKIVHVSQLHEWNNSEENVHTEQKSTMSAMSSKDNMWLMHRRTIWWHICLTTHWKLTIALQHTCKAIGYMVRIPGNKWYTTTSCQYWTIISQWSIHVMQIESKSSFIIFDLSEFRLVLSMHRWY